MSRHDHLELLRRDSEETRPRQQGLLGKCKRLLSRFDVTGRSAGCIRRIGLKNRTFTIIADNCWGGYVYQHYGLRYRSPFVGLFLFPRCFMELLEDFERHLASELRFIDVAASKYPQARDAGATERAYPVGVLGEGIEIHFLHYRSADQAREKWLQRKQRIDLGNALFKLSDRLDPAPDLVRRFDALPYRHKLFLAARSHPIPCARSPRDLDLKALLNSMIAPTHR